MTNPAHAPAQTYAPSQTADGLVARMKDGFVAGFKEGVSDVFSTSPKDYATQYLTTVAKNMQANLTYDTHLSEGKKAHLGQYIQNGKLTLDGLTHLIEHQHTNLLSERKPTGVKRALQYVKEVLIQPFNYSDALTQQEVAGITQAMVYQKEKDLTSIYHVHALSLLVNQQQTAESRKAVQGLFHMQGIQGRIERKWTLSKRARKIITPAALIAFPLAAGYVTAGAAAATFASLTLGQYAAKPVSDIVAKATHGKIGNDESHLLTGLSGIAAVCSYGYFLKEGLGYFLGVELPELNLGVHLSTVTGVLAASYLGKYSAAKMLKSKEAGTRKLGTHVQTLADIVSILAVPSSVVGGYVFAQTHPAPAQTIDSQELKTGDHPTSKYLISQENGRTSINAPEGRIQFTGNVNPQVLQTGINDGHITMSRGPDGSTTYDISNNYNPIVNSDGTRLHNASATLVASNGVTKQVTHWSTHQIPGSNDPYGTWNASGSRMPGDGHGDFAVRGISNTDPNISEVHIEALRAHEGQTVTIRDGALTLVYNIHDNTPGLDSFTGVWDALTGHGIDHVDYYLDGQFAARDSWVHSGQALVNEFNVSHLNPNELHTLTIKASDNDQGNGVDDTVLNFKFYVKNQMQGGPQASRSDAPGTVPTASLENMLPSQTTACGKQFNHLYHQNPGGELQFEREAAPNQIGVRATGQLAQSINQYVLWYDYAGDGWSQRQGDVAVQFAGITPNNISVLNAARDTNCDGTFDTPLDLTKGSWNITGAKQEGNTLHHYVLAAKNNAPYYTFTGVPAPGAQAHAPSPESAPHAPPAPERPSASDAQPDAAPPQEPPAPAKTALTKLDDLNALILHETKQPLSLTTQGKPTLVMHWGVDSDSAGLARLNALPEIQAKYPCLTYYAIEAANEDFSTQASDSEIIEKLTSKGTVPLPPGITLVNAEDISTWKFWNAHDVQGKAIDPNEEHYWLFGPDGKLMQAWDSHTVGSNNEDLLAKLVELDLCKAPPVAAAPPQPAATCDQVITEPSTFKWSGAANLTLDGKIVEFKVGDVPKVAGTAIDTDKLVYHRSGHLLSADELKSPHTLPNLKSSLSDEQIRAAYVAVPDALKGTCVDFFKGQVNGKPVSVVFKQDPALEKTNPADVDLSKGTIVGFNIPEEKAPSSQPPPPIVKAPPPTLAPGEIANLGNQLPDIHIHKFTSEGTIVTNAWTPGGKLVYYYDPKGNDITEDPSKWYKEHCVKGRVCHGIKSITYDRDAKDHLNRVIITPFTQAEDGTITSGKPQTLKPTDSAFKVYKQRLGEVVRDVLGKTDSLNESKKSGRKIM